MTNRASITFSQTGVQSPVYVVTSLSTPPWEPLEMNAEIVASGETVFTRQFENVAAGSYQYKVRVGEGQWVVDETKATGMDDAGNRNNVIHVEPDPIRAAADATAKEKRRGAGPIAPAQEKADTTTAAGYSDATRQDTGRAVPVPFVVVEKVLDEDRPENCDAEPQILSTDIPKRSADPESNSETIKIEAKPLPDLPPVPTVVVEKTDSKPSYGEDFGEDATSAQKVAHSLRVADASPDKIVVDVGHVEPGTPEEQAAPLFQHESLELDRTQDAGMGPGRMDTIEEESSKSSGDQKGSEASTGSSDRGEIGFGVTATTPPLTETRVNDELNNAPLLPHENGLGAAIDDELSNGPLLSHETGFSLSSDELDETGLFRREDDLDELDNGPLLSHEASGLSGYEASEDTTANSSLDDSSLSDNLQNADLKIGILESDYVPTLSHERPPQDGYGFEAPLLPHERSLAIPSAHGLEVLGSAPSTEDGQQGFAYEISATGPIFGGHAGRIFRTGSNSSTLPHRLPRSDAEDENLLDPALERFPTSRQQIFDRVATISNNLPEDETVESPISPELSVLSQACSSVDLAPVKSAASLQSVVEEESAEDEEAANLPSSTLGTSEREADRGSHSGKDTVISNPTHDSVVDPNETAGVRRDGGKHDNSKEWGKLYDSIATPSKVLDPFTPPLTPEKKGAQAKETLSASAKSLEAQYRRAPTSESMGITPAPPQPWEVQSRQEQSPRTDRDSKNIRTPSPPGYEHVDKPKETLFQSFIRVVFGPIGRFLTACVGGRKQAGGTLLAVGLAVAAYYYVYVLAD